MGGSAALLRNPKLLSSFGFPTLGQDQSQSAGIRTESLGVPQSDAGSQLENPGARGIASIQRSSTILNAGPNPNSGDAISGSLLGRMSDGSYNPGSKDGRPLTPEEAYQARFGKPLPDSGGIGNTNKEKLAAAGRIGMQNDMRQQNLDASQGIHAKFLQQEDLKKRVAKRGRASTYLSSPSSSLSGGLFRNTLLGS